MKSALVTALGSALADPPFRQAALCLQARGYRVSVLQVKSTIAHPELPIEGARMVLCPRVKAGALRSLRQYFIYCRQLQKFLSIQPTIVITASLRETGGLPARWRIPNSLTVCAVLDIPVAQDLGRLDQLIYWMGWRRLAQADVVWSSDIYKARLAQEIAGLPELPLVCHNCPPRDYLPEPGVRRDGWLRAELRRAGATIGETGGSILLRAGAVGEYGGIEETLAGMARLPEDYIFILMGRPPDDYKKHLRACITSRGLERRAIFWDCPSDEVWKKALQGADIGHLIHGPFPAGRMARLYEKNSSLSNNRLFQYMAAGLPIIAYDDPRLKDIYAEVPCFRVARLSHLEEDITAGWAELGVDAAQRLRLGAAGRAGHLRTYYWERQFAPVLDAIENAVRRKAR